MPSVCQRVAQPTVVGVTFLMECHQYGGLKRTSPGSSTEVYTGQYLWKRGEQHQIRALSLTRKESLGELLEERKGLLVVLARPQAHEHVGCSAHNGGWVAKECVIWVHEPPLLPSVHLSLSVLISSLGGMTLSRLEREEYLVEHVVHCGVVEG
jgi:hypothetical protein